MDSYQRRFNALFPLRNRSFLVLIQKGGVLIIFNGFFSSVFGYDYELKDFLGKQASEVILKTSSIQWKEFLRKESILRRRWIEVLDPYLDCRDFVNSVFCLLKGIRKKIIFIEKFKNRSFFASY